MVISFCVISFLLKWFILCFLFCVDPCTVSFDSLSSICVQFVLLIFEIFVKLWIIRSFQYRHLRHHRMLDHPYFSHSFCFDPFLFIFHHVCLCVIDFHFSSLHFLFSLLPFLFIFHRQISISSSSFICSSIAIRLRSFSFVSCHSKLPK
eukprot:376779_1